MSWPTVPLQLPQSTVGSDRVTAICTCMYSSNPRLERGFEEHETSDPIKRYCLRQHDKGLINRWYFFVSIRMHYFHQMLYCMSCPVTGVRQWVGSMVAIYIAPVRQKDSDSRRKNRFHKVWIAVCNSVTLNVSKIVIVQLSSYAFNKDFR